MSGSAKRVRAKLATMPTDRVGWVGEEGQGVHIPQRRPGASRTKRLAGASEFPGVRTLQVCTRRRGSAKRGSAKRVRAKLATTRGKPASGASAISSPHVVPAKANPRLGAPDLPSYFCVGPSRTKSRETSGSGMKRIHPGRGWRPAKSSTVARLKQESPQPGGLTGSPWVRINE